MAGTARDDSAARRLVNPFLQHFATIRVSDLIRVGHNVTSSTMALSANNR
jgi:hypothetical protein